jgi:hypothetical protein
MSKMFQVYGVGQALFPVLPPPIAFENAPTSNQTNFEIGQVVYTPPLAPTAFYLYSGAGIWSLFASASGDIIAIAGTASQIVANTAAGTTTLSLPSALIAPGSVAATTTLTATLGAITATNGNLVLGTLGNKLVIPAGTNGSVGVTGVMSGSPGAVSVASTAITTSSIILYSRATTGGTPGQVSITSQTTGNFTLTSTGNETSTFNYLIIN